MTALAALRAACQRGEMPRFIEVVRATDQRSDWWQWHDEEAWKAGRYLDAMAALQQALWPGSRVDIGWGLFNDAPVCNAIIYHPAAVKWRLVGTGNECPTEATARLDAILAGLQKEALE